MEKKINFTRRDQRKRTIENVGFMQIKDAAEGGVELYIYGDIVSSYRDKWTPEDTYPQEIAEFLNSIDGNAELTVYINSCGGDVFAGIGIYNILKRHKGHITGIVDGIAASIASVILMACDEIIVSTGAQIMIHKPMTMVWGNADDFSTAISQLDTCQQMITDIYMTRAREGVTKDALDELINAETWMSEGEESECRASDYFTIKVDETSAAAAACVGHMMNRFKRAPTIMKIETVEDIEARQQQADEVKEILDDLYLYGV